MNLKNSLITIICLVGLVSCTTSTPSSPTITKPVTIDSGSVIQEAIPTVTVSGGARSIPTPTYGSGKLQFEIFADFQCPACISFSENIGPILESYAASGKVMITYRQFPLPMHKNAFGDAIAALCSAEQGRYMNYKKWLYALEESKAGATTTDEDRITLAKNMGLDAPQFESCLVSRSYEAQVNADIAYGDSKWVNATPSIYMNGTRLDMSIFRDLDGFRSFIENRVQ